jgi:hypothetical protein
VPPGYGQAPPPGYGQVPPGYGYPPAPPTSNKAVAGLVLGIASILFCYLGLLLGPAAIIVSVLARKDIDAAQTRFQHGYQTGPPQGPVRGKGMAITGLVTGIIGTVIWGGFLALVIIGASLE